MQNLKEWSDLIGCTDCDPELQDCRVCNIKNLINEEENDTNNRKITER